MSVDQEDMQVPTHHSIPFGKEALSVLDHGGQGRDVLLLHAPGYCAPAWQVVAPLLEGLHAYALDLPGHGHSTGILRDAVHVQEAVAAVTDAFELQAPVIVANDATAYAALLQAVEHPGQVGALVTIGGFCLRAPQVFADVVEFARAPDLADLLRQRFLFGLQGQGEESRRGVIDDMVSRVESDWLLHGIRDGLAAEVDWSLPTEPDGSWTHRPLPESVQNTYLIPEGRPRPSPELYAQVTQPTRLIMVTDGQDSDLIGEAENLARTHDHITLTTMAGGYGPHYVGADTVAQVIAEAAALA